MGKNKLTNAELNKKIKELIKSQVSPSVPSDFNVSCQTDNINIHISIINDPDDTKYYATKYRLMQYEKALIISINLEFGLEIQTISY